MGSDTYATPEQKQEIAQDMESTEYALDGFAGHNIQTILAELADKQVALTPGSCRRV